MLSRPVSRVPALAADFCAIQGARMQQEERPRDRSDADPGRAQLTARALSADLRRLSLAKWDVMKLIRELIANGAVLGRYRRCESCFDEKRVVTIRSRPSAR